MTDFEPFFNYARKRHSIYLQRAAGTPPPWTEDPVLRLNRFCNVFRELDKTTAWFRENIREPLRDKPWEVTLATVAFRWFNKIEVGEVLLDPSIGLMNGEFDSFAARTRLKGAFPKGPYVTGAYIIKTPDGKTKLDGVLWCIDNFAAGMTKNGRARDMRGIAQSAAEDNARGEGSLELDWEWLRGFPFLGDFMAYEVVTDLRHTCVLDKATDIMEWANPGPGATRGWERLAGLPLGSLNRSSPRDRQTLMVGMKQLLEASRTMWPGREVWEMRDVEHTLCEYDKYIRAKLGGRMKQRFNDGA